MASVFSVIEQRHSVRTYASQELKASEIDFIEALFPQLPKIGVGEALDWTLKTQTPVGSGKLYAVLFERSPANLVEYGFQGEALTLKLTEKGFGTCWLALGRAVEKNTPAVIVFGTEAKDSVYEKMSRIFLRSNKRRDLEELLTSESLAPTHEQERILIAMRHAPSAVNRQPWRFSVRESRCIHVRRTGGKPEYSFIDLGIVLCHGYLAALELFGSAAVSRLEDDLYELSF